MLNVDCLFKKNIEEYGEKIMNKKKIEEAVTMILEAIGEDTTREGLRDTPERVARMYEEICCGLYQDPTTLTTCFTEEHQELVVIRDIYFYSLCEHHLLPFFGNAHIAYIPRSGKVAGLSKMARLVEIYARRPQLQERLTKQIASFVMENLKALGVMVIMEAEHMCMTMRGVNKPGSLTITSAVRGALHSDETLRLEALSLIRDH